MSGAVSIQIIYLKQWLNKDLQLSAVSQAYDSKSYISNPIYQ